MGCKTISRRGALGIIGKTSISLLPGAYFFLSLRTSPFDAALQVTEKVVISGFGSTLIFKISGPAGRHCGVCFALTNSREYYKPASNARGLIGENGLVTIQVDAKGLPNGKVFIRVVTGASREFNKGARGTQAFEVTIANGVVTMFGGVRERPLEGSSAAASCATTGYDPKVR